MRDEIVAYYDRCWCLFLLFFFFSSRRRHTRFDCDWSSDVCSSDLTRTPYSATELTSHAASAHLGPILWGYDNATEVIVEGGYIRVVQDVRGKYDSEGDYVMNRPLHGPLNPTPVDHSTDTYDTIDWLVKNLPESNGRRSEERRVGKECRSRWSPDH